MAEKATAKEALEKLKNKLECTICLTDYTDPKLLPCFHVFCKKCLEPLVIQIMTVSPYNVQSVVTQRNCHSKEWLDCNLTSMLSTCLRYVMLSRKQNSHKRRDVKNVRMTMPQVSVVTVVNLSVMPAPLYIASGSNSRVMR